jgi:hypothetical protein
VGSVPHNYHSTTQGPGRRPSRLIAILQPIAENMSSPDFSPAFAHRPLTGTGGAPLNTTQQCRNCDEFLLVPFEAEKSGKSVLQKNKMGPW